MMNFNNELNNELNNFDLPDNELVMPIADDEWVAIFADRASTQWPSKNRVLTTEIFQKLAWCTQ